MTRWQITRPIITNTLMSQSSSSASEIIPRTKDQFQESSFQKELYGVLFFNFRENVPAPEYPIVFISVHLVSRH